VGQKRREKSKGKKKLISSVPRGKILLNSIKKRGYKLQKDFFP